jgi:hypothetical protein
VARAAEPWPPALVSAALCRQASFLARELGDYYDAETGLARHPDRTADVRSSCLVPSDQHLPWLRPGRRLDNISCCPRGIFPLMSGSCVLIVHLL